MIMKFFYFFTILCLFNTSCDKNENNSDLNIIEPNKELVTTTIYINQTVDGVNIDRPVIIQTPDNIDSVSYTHLTLPTTTSV